MATDKTARATWEGDLMSGSGRVSTGSDVLSDEGVSWSARAEGAEGVSPEELIAAAHATCVSMALSHGLAEDGHAPTRLESSATATFDKTDAGFRMTKIRLEIEGEVDGIDEAEFRQAAEGAKDNCPVSKALEGNVEISVEAKLSSPSPARSE
ncbi:MAG: OsmC family protein [Actinobacteria bacterium]|jgi:osmotically inducible protein OsmC|nr:MAG: OsmC family protein [Actinomycetota bacterium]